jgi:hypothetical protein
MTTTSVRSPTVGLLLGSALAASVACSTGGKEKVTKTALDAMSKTQRLEEFEATARVLDQHPELVDEFYAAARSHKPLLERFNANFVNDLHDRAMAETNAKYLVNRPDALEQVQITTIDYIRENPAARAALDRAMIARAEQTTEILTDSPEAVSRMLDASLDVLERKPSARRAALVAVRKNRARLLAFAKEDPGLMKDMTEEVVKELVKDKPVVEKALRAAKVIDDDDAKR